MTDDETDPFKEFYETAGDEKTPRPVTGNPRVSEDAKLLREPINNLLRKMNAMIGEVFEQEKAKGTRTDLIVTLVIGGLAFTVANVFYMLTKTQTVKMSLTEYEATFMGMFQTAINDIEKNAK